jgi:hypothetical protein
MAAMKEIHKAMVGFPRQLRWDDFGRVDQSPQPPMEAMTASKYEITQSAYTSGTAANDNRGSYFVDPLKVTVSFVASNSWAVPWARTNPRLLAHEQGHFDITGLIARDFTRRLLDLRVYGHELIDANNLSAANNALDKKVAQVRKRMHALWEFLQGGEDDLYDTDTLHGTNEAGQREWSALLHHVKLLNVGFEEALIARGFIRILSDPQGGPPTYA